MEKEAKTPPAKTVDEYLSNLPEPVQRILENIRQAIKTAAPEAEEAISYQIPTYKYRGALVHFAAFSKHCSFFGVNKKLFEQFAEELKPFKIAGTTIHFTPENPLPASLIQKLVKARVQENEARKTVKQA